MFILLILISTIIFTTLSYFFHLDANIVGYEIDKVYISITTFLFSIFNGFFISRQAGRYNEIRNTFSKIDAKLSSIYRNSTHLSKKMVKKISNTILNYYETRKNWEYYLSAKTNLITDLHNIIDEEEKNNTELTSLQKERLKKILTYSDDIQTERKNLVALSQENVGIYQYSIVILLAIILIILLFGFNSVNSIIISIIKAIFINVIFIVIWTLNRFDKLKLFEKNVGEHTSLDVIEIIKGNR